MPRDSAGNPRSGFARAGYADKVAGEREPKTEGKKAMDKPHAAGTEHKSDVSHMDIGEVVKQHGPAHHVVSHHDHEAGVHTVTSHHGKAGAAHMHHSEHSSAEDAHEHQAKALGLHQEGDAYAGEETPEEEMAEEKAAGGSIPGMM